MKRIHKRILFWCLLLLVALGLFFSGTKIINLALKQIYLLKYENIILPVSVEFDLKPELVLAVIHTESKFDERALSYRGARGLMQITPDTLEWIMQKENTQQDINADMLYDAKTNIKYGSMILHYHIQEFGDLKTALCAYNAGRTNVKKWLEDERYSDDGKTLDSIPFKETNDYVIRVLSARDMYKKLYFNK